MQVIYERCAGIDVGKDVIAVAVRKPGDGPGGRVTVKRMYKTFCSGCCARPRGGWCPRASRTWRWRRPGSTRCPSTTR